MTWQPVDQALAQSGQQLRRSGDRALRGWQHFFATAPHATLPFYWLSARPQLSSLVTSLLSQSLGDQCRAAARDLRASLPAVYLALLAVMVRFWTGHDCCVIGVTLGNRSTPRLGVEHRSYPARPAGVSEDSGWYLDRTGGATFLLGCAAADGHPDLHSPEFDFDEAVLLTAVDVFHHLAVDGTSHPTAAAVP